MQFEKTRTTWVVAFGYGRSYAVRSTTLQLEGLATPKPFWIAVVFFATQEAETKLQELNIGLRRPD